jgi:hypothetical protein
MATPVWGQRRRPEETRTRVYEDFGARGSSGLCRAGGRESAALPPFPYFRMCTASGGKPLK